MMSTKTSNERGSEKESCICDDELDCCTYEHRHLRGMSACEWRTVNNEPSNGFLWDQGLLFA